MAASTSVPFPLATEHPYTGGQDTSAGNPNAGGADVDSAAGAAGSTPGAVEISHGAMIAIIVVVCVVGVFGIASAVLFYVAKKREWKVRESLRRSARRVVTALTPKRSEFPKSVKDSQGRASRSRGRGDDVPPTPRLPVDIEKGVVSQSEREQSSESRKKWGRK